MAAGAAAPVPLYHHSKWFFAHILDVLHSPRAVFQDLARAPRFLAVLSLTFLVSAGATAAVLETEVGHFALLDQWERTATALGQDIDDVQYAAMMEASENGTLCAVASSFVSGPLLAVALSGLLFATFRPSPPRSVSYRQVLAVVAHAGVVLALRQVVAAPFTYVRERLGSPVTLSLLSATLDEASVPSRLAGAVDLFIIWWVIVLAIGTSVLYKRPARRMALMFVGAYVTLVVLLTVTLALTGGAA
jgi:hypothetical protein